MVQIMKQTQASFLTLMMGKEERSKTSINLNAKQFSADLYCIETQNLSKIKCYVLDFKIHLKTEKTSIHVGVFQPGKPRCHRKI